MSERDNSNLPAQISSALTSIPKGFIPASIKALDRLLGAGIDLPVAWLAQKKAKIDAQTEAFRAVEASIAKAAATEAGASPELVQQAMVVLVRKEYRKQANKEAVASAMLEDLREHSSTTTSEDDTNSVLDEDWLNVFERYAEDASTERMQKLWGRVLAGEVRKPGRYAMRTLRFVSEFSQADGLTFSEFCESAFGDTAPMSLVKPDAVTDIRHLIYLEAAGVIQGSAGSLTISLSFNAAGNAILRENNILLVLTGVAGSKVQFPTVSLTPLGQELLSLLPQRDVRAAARRVANSLKQPAITSAYIAILQNENVIPIKVVW